MDGEAPRTYICEQCGNEANMILREAEAPPQAGHAGHVHQATLVCKVCGNEANIILGEEEAILAGIPEEAGYLPAPYTKFHHLFPAINRAYADLANKCHREGPLNERTRRLVKLGIAVGCKSEGAVKSHARRAMAMGISREEIHHVVLLSLTTIGFPAMIAALNWVDEVPEK